MPPHLAVGHFMGCGALGCDHIGYGLGLGQVHLAVDESPLGEFPWSGHPGSGAAEQGKKLLDYVSGCMA